jgi:hypothetical protein
MRVNAEHRFSGGNRNWPIKTYVTCRTTLTSWKH